jgi:hypothetical protein
MEDLGTGNAFGLSVCLAANAFVLSAQKLEILFFNENPRAKRDCQISLLFESVPRLVMFVLGAVVAGYGCGTRCELGSGRHDDGASDDDAHPLLKYITVSCFLFGSHAFGTLLPLLLSLLKARAVTDIPWHTKVESRLCLMSFLFQHK